VVIPLAGRGRRFTEKGYTFPKPLIELDRRTMIEAVLANLRVPVPSRFHFVCLTEHLRHFHLGDLLRILVPGAQIIPADSESAGALCSVMLAADFLDPRDELLVANGDQIIHAPLAPFYDACREPGVDGCILTFDAVHPRWSYARTGANGRVVEVAEKKPISRQATAGLYYFRRAGDFLRAAESTLMKGLRTQEQFYVCPVYNELLLDAMVVTTSHLPEGSMQSLGTPEDVEQYQARLRATTVLRAE
jgi:NDP-sugar pyrophosphorylase family protein